MKIKAIPFLLTAFSLVSCNGDTPFSGQLLSWKEGDTLSLSFQSFSYTIERGRYLTLKVDVSSNRDDIQNRVSFSVVQDGNVVELQGEYSNTDGSVSILGKEEGKATLIATSLDRQDVVAKAEIEVIKRIPALNKVWQNINEMDNYTIENERALKSEPSSYVRNTKISITENVVLYEKYLQSGELTPLFCSSDGKEYILGSAVDRNDNAFELHTDLNGRFLSDGKIIKTERGFLNRENFHGFGEDSQTVNDVGIFYGLQAINSSWLAKAKAIDNVYPIEGDIKDPQSCYVEYLIWGLVDPLGRYSYLERNPDITDISVLSSLIDVEIKAESSNDITVALKYHDDIYINGESENYDYKLHLENIRSTKDEDYPGLASFLKLETASFPSLNAPLKLFAEGIENDDYLFSRELYWSNPNDKYNPYHATFRVYYTEDYMMAYFSRAMVDALYRSTGTKSEVMGVGFMKKKDGIHEFIYHPDQSTSLEIYPVVANTKDVKLSECNFDLAKDYNIPNYLSSSDYYQNHNLNALSDYPGLVFSNLKPYYYTHNKSGFDDFCRWFMNDTVSGNDFYTGVNVQLDSSGEKIQSVSFLAAFSEEENNYKLLYTPVLSHFGSAGSQNEADALLQKEIQQ